MSVIIGGESNPIKPLTIFDNVATLEPNARDRLTLVEPEYDSVKQLPTGQVGTIVEIYKCESPRYLVEFSDQIGREYAMATLTFIKFGEHNL